MNARAIVLFVETDNKTAAQSLGYVSSRNQINSWNLPLISRVKTQISAPRDKKSRSNRVYVVISIGASHIGADEDDAFPKVFRNSHETTRQLVMEAWAEMVLHL